MFRSILVPLDGSGFAESALPWALALARAGGDSGVGLHLAAVHEPVPSYAYDEWDAAAWEWTDEYMAKVRGRLEPLGVGSVDAWVGTGRVVDSLLGRAGEVGADLVVMATHGRGAVTRAWLGSVTDAFVRQSEIPVLVVRPPSEVDGPVDLETPLGPPTAIVVPLDGSDLAESELVLARELARSFGAALHLVRIVAYPVEIASPYLPHTVQMNQQLVDDARDAALGYLETQAAVLREAGFTVHVHALVDAQPAHAIAEVVDETGAGLVIMATHGRGGLQRALLGSTTDKVIRSLDVPVLVRRPVTGAPASEAPVTEAPASEASP